jgi:hypothetical protein
MTIDQQIEGRDVFYVGRFQEDARGRRSGGFWLRMPNFTKVFFFPTTLNLQSGRQGEKIFNKGLGRRARAFENRSGWR